MALRQLLLLGRGYRMKTIKVCVGSACHVKGSYKVVETLRRMIKERELEKDIELVGSLCMGKCTEGVSIEYDEIIYIVTPDNVEEILGKIMEENH
jgi:NADH:ubiquinone oxidoreductase subunit E